MRRTTRGATEQYAAEGLAATEKSCETEESGESGIAHSDGRPAVLRDRPAQSDESLLPRQPDGLVLGVPPTPLTTSSFNNTYSYSTHTLSRLQSSTVNAR